jgi:antitoxin component YwqK of YwqJK toxin-antitoxin module
MSYINGIPAEQWIEENKPKNGLFRVYWTEDEEGVSFKNTGLPIRFEWYYKDGKYADGVSKGWFSDGGLKHEQEWKDGVRHGKDIWYYRTGQKSEEGIYLNNFQHGKWTYWNENGETTAEVIYRRGKILKVI